MICCSACGSTQPRRSRYCGACGAAQGPTLPDLQTSTERSPATAGHEIRFLLVFYGFCLLLSVFGYLHSQWYEDPFRAELLQTWLFGAVTFGFAWRAPGLTWIPLGQWGMGWRGYLAITLVSVPLGLVVIGYVDGLSGLFELKLPGELDSYRGLSLFWPVLLGVVMAPLFEEIAFRGLILGGLQRSLTLWESLVVSAFAFAMVHLAVPSLVTHLPLGLYLGWLRHRSGSLWPPIYAHACYNLVIMLWEWHSMH